MHLLDSLALDIGRDADAPLHRQLYSGLVEKIAGGALKPGEKLPSTRDFARLLGVSRNTVLLAFDNLISEGFLQPQTGSGTYVARELPEQRPAKAPARINPAIRAAGQLNGSLAPSTAITNVPLTLRHMRRPVPFRANFPAVDMFPVQRWASLAAGLYRSLDPETAGELLGEGDPQGYEPLRIAIAEHVALSRGLTCGPQNIVIFAGAQHAVDLACRILLTPGESVWCEDPGYDGIYASATAAGAVPVAVPVDEEGLLVGEGIARAPDARLAYVSPSKQFPLGMELSLERRHALLQWASGAGAWILEDDYDTEFRYAGRPMPALHALDREGRVLYFGTFSKMLFPGLRLGFAVLPDALVEPFVAARTVVGRYSPMFEQALVARFMEEGHLAAHVRRMRRLYAQRQDYLLDAIATHLAPWMTASPTNTGMEIIVRLAPGLSARQIAQAAARRGLEILPIAALAREAEMDDLITMGFSAFGESQIDEGIAVLADILTDARRAGHGA
ncbi:PLP-dependent aminotransferase family protein [Ancylobacter sp. 6x-1]|uniref:PLP-dependent aminotransferase family protein n=1 Tax=Ancylobacter crimeensis TaxID=2579147 RepID=A0ABT0D9I3_9HYPH|nr:PLP-dependent aminotransferase family protein [Ancylobacter crimeensis]MCK0196616.1 PLP-dependent aminotransferase family protein [Ancylobacter crimeensis]